MNQPARVYLLAALASVGAIASCSPTVTFSVGFGGGGERLREGTVAGDVNATAKVLMIDVRGLLADEEGSGLSGLVLPPSNPVDELTRRLEAAAKDKDVKAIVLRINSPGGTVTASHIMYEEVRRFATGGAGGGGEGGRPVVASLGEVAASGGYYLALAADKIVAEPTSITGSIGVIIPTMNASEGLARIGIHSRNITSGPNKDLADPFSPAREPHYAVLQTIVDDMYVRFKALVTERRGSAGLKAELFGELTDGRVITGARAAEVGLADRTGGVRDAFEEAKKLAGLSTAKLVKYHTGSGRVSTPYAAGSVPPPAAGPTEINMVQFQLGSGRLPGSGGANVYYLWMP